MKDPRWIVGIWSSHKHYLTKERCQSCKEKMSNTISTAVTTKPNRSKGFAIWSILEQSAKVALTQQTIFTEMRICTKKSQLEHVGTHDQFGRDVKYAKLWYRKWINTDGSNLREAEHGYRHLGIPQLQDTESFHSSQTFYHLPAIILFSRGMSPKSWCFSSPNLVLAFNILNFAGGSRFSMCTCLPTINHHKSP